MRLFYAGITSATLLLAVIGTSAQQKPNFSGTWVVVSPAESAGEETTIKHDATTFTHGHASEGGGHSFAYKLDGTETRITMPSHGDEIVILARASWDGDRLAIVEQVTYPDGRKADGTTMWSLDAQGQLVREFVRKEEGQPPRTSKVISKKKTAEGWRPASIVGSRVNSPGGVVSLESSRRESIETASNPSQTCHGSSSEFAASRRMPDTASS